MPDRIGNLYGTPDRKDRKYGAGGRLEEDEEFFYHYDDEGNLIYKEFRTLQDGVVNYRRKEEEKELNLKFRSTGTGWRYDWQSNGMLKRVIRPDEKAVHFRYDALGRRTAKMFKGTVTRWVWDGNVPLHEWEYKTMRLQVPSTDGDKKESPVEPTEDITTWIFEAGTFVPAAKIKGDKQYSIVTDYLGTPIQMYDEEGEKTWDCTLDVYGKVSNFEGRSLSDCPFRFQGQYEDEETGLYYNRFRYYSPNEGIYLSQDPIKLQGGWRLYNYVHDTNTWLDPIGLTPWGDMGITFKDWFDNHATPDLIKANKTSVEDALRGSGGMHEKFPVSMAGKAKDLGFTYDELMGMTLPRDQVFFENVPDKYGNLHSGPHSTGAALPEGMSSKASSWFHKDLNEKLLKATSKDEALKIIEEHHNKYVKGHQH